MTDRPRLGCAEALPGEGPVFNILRSDEQSLLSRLRAIECYHGSTTRFSPEIVSLAESAREKARANVPNRILSIGTAQCLASR